MFGIFEDNFLDALTGDGAVPDGNPDIEDLAEPMDMDGDGINDTTVTELDTNENGITDTIVMESDMDQDGLADSTVTSFDQDENSVFETTLVEVDQDENGESETDVFFYDKDQDGQADSVEMISKVDTDNDGIIDTIITSVDSNADGNFDSTEVSPFTAALGDIADNEDGYRGEDGVWYRPTFEADEVESMDDIIGDPEGDMENWHMQQHDDTCAVVSQEFVLEELLNREFNEEELRDLALENGWYEDGGTPMQAIGNILEYYGLEVDQSQDGTIEDIEACLEKGGSVIVGLDADEIWEPGMDDYADDSLYDPVFAPGMGANHAVEVIGVDRSDPDNPMVILNDPGHPGGCGAMIPLEEFEDAWEDSNCFLVEAYNEA